jgi:chromate transport protein ChrA
MKSYRLLRGLKIVVVVILAALLFGLVTMHLWNWLMPAVFGLTAITFTQALGLLVLSKILFGGFHRHGGGRGWKRHMQERFAQMTPEERERFRAGMRGRRGCWGPRETAPEQSSQQA